MIGSWTNEDKQILIDFYGVIPTKDLLDILKRTEKSLRKETYRLRVLSRTDPITRFNSHLLFTDKLFNGIRCIEWAGYKDRDGYGNFSYEGETWQAHRWCYEQIYGPINDILTIDHLCRNRACINPIHMELVTNAENVLRGYGICAQNARKTHCKRSHEFTIKNTYVLPNGGRVCRTCRKDIKERYKMKLEKS